MSSNSDDRLNWLATQYVLGELAESERDAFELRLAEDLAACEAVARAAQLTMALQAVYAESPVRIQLQHPTKPEVRRSGLAVGISIAAVACLFLVMIFWSGNIVDQSEFRSTGHRTRDAAELVSRWRSDSRTIDDDADDVDDDAQEIAADVVVPGWLLAGVQLEKHGSVEDDPEELQDN